MITKISDISEMLNKSPGWSLNYAIILEKLAQIRNSGVLLSNDDCWVVFTNLLQMLLNDNSAHCSGTTQKARFRQSTGTLYFRVEEVSL